MKHVLQLSIRLLTVFALLTLACPQAVIAQVPEEPVDIIRGVPQFFVDDWLVDNRFAIK